MYHHWPHPQPDDDPPDLNATPVVVLGQMITYRNLARLRAAELAPTIEEPTGPGAELLACLVAAEVWESAAQLVGTLLDKKPRRKGKQ